MGDDVAVTDLDMAKLATANPQPRSCGAVDGSHGSRTIVDGLKFQTNGS
jgi:hypothetical protein